MRVGSQAKILGKTMTGNVLFAAGNFMLAFFSTFSYSTAGFQLKINIPVLINLISASDVLFIAILI